MEAKKEACTNRLSPGDDSSKDDNNKKLQAVRLGGVHHGSPQQGEDDSSLADDSESSQKVTGKDDKTNKKRDFPSKLHEMLHDSKVQGHEHIISWGPDGKSFKVHEPEDFVTEVMPKYFNQTKYRSFQRMVGAVKRLNNTWKRRRRCRSRHKFFIHVISYVHF